MKYTLLKKIESLQNEVGEVVDVVDVGGRGEEIEQAVNGGILELCEDQSVKNKHCMVLADVEQVKLTVNKPN